MRELVWMVNSGRQNCASFSTGRMDGGSVKSTTLSLASKSIKEIRFPHTLRVPIWNLHSMFEESNQLQEHSFSALRKLRKLSLIIKPYSNKKPSTDQVENKSMLESMLLNAPNLKELNIFFPRIAPAVFLGHVPLAKLFPNKQYPSLITLRLQGIKAPKNDLAEFFEAQSHLRHLELSDIRIKGCSCQCCRKF